MSVRKKVDKLLRSFEKEFIVQNGVELSSFAFKHNVDYFHQLTKLAIIPVLKSNAYGHGLEPVATILSSRRFPYIAVDSYVEALHIRDVSPQPVLILGTIDPRNYRILKVIDFSFVISDPESLHAIGNTGKAFIIHFEINSGMNRYGINPQDLPGMLDILKGYPNLTLEGVMSHLADSEGTDPKTVDDAVAIFDTAVDHILEQGFSPSLLHVAQSAGSVRANSKHANAMRLGIGLYGINPFTPDHEKYHVLQKHLLPALTLTSTIAQIRQLQAGDKVSYSYTFTADQPMRLGVLPIGFADGLDWAAFSNAGVVKVGDVYCPIVGRVCMNHTMINLEGTHAAVGDRVVLYSNNPHDHTSVESICREYDLFHDELLTRINPEIRRLIMN